ncbi:MAG: DUF3943 domain-containing protein [Muribaculaceae bacterium]|nr:DUF3943 domain-containing protein [Muribaculaceae bacterium]
MILTIVSTLYFIMLLTFILTIMLAIGASTAKAAPADLPEIAAVSPQSLALPTATAHNGLSLPAPTDPIASMAKESVTPSVYMFPYSWRKTCEPNWHRMWVNTAVLTGAFVSTLFVLELLPEDATAWNRRELESKPFYRRWYDNIFKLNPEVDHDNLIFNYILHPYAGAAYFMSARSCGFNFFQSMLYSALISTVEWEFGIEACMERPSYQDIIITPMVGSLFGELFYHAKRHIVNHDYTLLGSRLLGNIVVFIVDPVNEVINLFRGSYERQLHLGRPDPSAPQLSSAFMPTPGGMALSLRYTF